MSSSKYIPLSELEVYKLSRQISKIAWKVYQSFDWQIRRITGNQFIESTDSVGANIAEGYSRFHFLDKIKFYYNSRASLAESSDHWMELIYERQLVDEGDYKDFKIIAKQLNIKLNNFIRTTYNSRNYARS